VPAHRCEQRAHIEHRAAAPPHHRGDKTAAQVDGRLEIEPQDSDLPLDPVGGELPGDGRAGVIAEDGDLQYPLGHGGCEELSGTRLGEVAVDGVDPDALPAEPAGQRVQPVPAPGDQHQVVPARGQGTSQFGTQARRCAGHQRGGPRAWLR
jgi:hypothetical protein